jgi:hypothetical protein
MIWLLVLNKKLIITSFIGKEAQKMIIIDLIIQN